MTYRDGILAIIALALSAAALTGMVHVDAYTQAAQAEASAYAALTHQISHHDVLLRANEQAWPAAQAGASR
jgi:hypothetical protein